MASTSAVSMALPLSPTTQTKVSIPNPFLNPLPLKHSSMAATPTTRPNATKLEIKASSSSSNKEKAVTILTAAAMTTSMMVPEIAQAADGVTPSLKNFLLSIAAGGVVLVAIIGAVIGVSNFDPVKRS
ncbi:Photosystem II PsbX [Gossypium australe]|uniref:Photosystem II PsbX n=1 Tax=Gossypium australe TaxID=47621 RepID=A0A5B6UJC7_9ROSI|nr:Photosystem II PsbX [Gossypium australe]